LGLKICLNIQKSDFAIRKLQLAIERFLPVVSNEALYESFKLITLQVMFRRERLLCITLILIGGLIVSNIALSQTSGSMRPSLVAIQVDNLDKSIAWYKDYLGFLVLERREFKEYGMTIAVLKLRDFRLELVDNEKALNKNSMLKKNEANDMTGFAKVTFTIDSVDSLYDRMKMTGASCA
jgi:hypothetical protein